MLRTPVSRLRSCHLPLNDTCATTNKTCAAAAKACIAPAQLPMTPALQLLLTPDLLNWLCFHQTAAELRTRSSTFWSVPSPSSVVVLTCRASDSAACGSLICPSDLRSDLVRG
ncbi:hypothetical protein FQA47_001489 [Oryzias melastigma]|uniref:Uncharacterized protein n=1 Tax=Oryzias melastigma TaxID=30732 RepID=A0A834L2F3_ORYME|nr:hypothetical protein FQA47_001489 [Oryzias melastigma]